MAWRAKHKELIRFKFFALKKHYKFVGLSNWIFTQSKLIIQQGVKRRFIVLVKKTFKFISSNSLVFMQKYPKLKSKIIRVSRALGLYDALYQYKNKLQHRSTEASSLKVKVTSSYLSWSRAYDTPTNYDLSILESTINGQEKVCVICKFDQLSSSNAVELAKRLIESIGQPWKALFLFSDGVESDPLKKKILSMHGHHGRFVFEPQEWDFESSIKVLIQGNVLPRTHALRIFVDSLVGFSDQSIAYSDEDEIQGSGVILNPWFKPRYSPTLAMQGLLFGGMVAIKDKSIGLYSIISHLQKGNSISDFILSYVKTLRYENIVHIPHVLYHSIGASVVGIPLNFSLPSDLPKVSIIIPTKDRWDLLGPCLESVLKSNWDKEKLEVIVIDNGSSESTTLKNLEILEGSGEIIVLKDSGVFNWSRLNNLAASKASGEVFIFLNNDTLVIDLDWIRKMAVHVLRPEVGAVGCKLLYGDRSVQHGGVVAGIHGVAGHANLFIGADEGGYRDLANITREVSAVTGACLMVSRKVFDSVSGFDEKFRVAFNDVIFCFSLISKGLFNIYVSDPLLLHFESKSRGYDDTKEKKALNREETAKAWLEHPTIMRNDPFYSPNLSLWRVYDLSFAPRHKAAWKKYVKRKPKVMILSITHAVGHGVPVVISLQANALIRKGYEVVIGGPVSSNDFKYPGCERIEVFEPIEAIVMAAKLGVDVIIPQTPPFFGVSKWVGNYPKVICYDYGEPPPEMFPDAEQRREVLHDKDVSLQMSHYVYAISDAIKSESRTFVTGVITLGNTHLGQWNNEAKMRRDVVRKRLGWDDKFVILNVCRFHKAERFYKGIDVYINANREVQADQFLTSKKIKFVLCGKGTQEDVESIRAEGLDVYANVRDEDMYDLYCASDAYLNFSKWEGFNLGIAQALSMGLPVLASNIPAHEAFGVDLIDRAEDVVGWIKNKIKEPNKREPVFLDWDPSFDKLVRVIDEACEGL